MSVSEIVQRLELLEEHCKIEATKVARLWGMHEGVLALQMPHVVPNGPALRPGESTGVRSEAEPWKTYNPLPASLDSEPIPVATPAAIERETPKPPKASGLRTERVTLELTHKDHGQPLADWPWRCILKGEVVVCRSVAESVRVVEEALDAGAERLREERDAAIRQREEFRRSFHRSEEAGTRLVAERDASRDDADTLRARVADLEGETKGLRGDARAAEKESERLRGQLESVADRAATAETALEAARAASEWRMLKVGETIEAGDEMTDDLLMPWRDAGRCVGQEVASGIIAYRRRVPAPAASGAGLTPHVRGVVRALIDAAEAVRDWAGPPFVRNEDRYRSEVDDLGKAIAAAEALLVNPLPSVPASDAAGTDVAEIARLAFDAGFGSSREGFNAECAHDHLAPKESMFEGAGGEPYEKLKRDSLAKIMSEAAPQPAPGWLTPEERKAVAAMAASQGRDSVLFDQIQAPDHAKAAFRRSKVLAGILARSSPPEVVAPDQEFRSHSNALRDAEWLAAIAASGGKVKEVGCE